MVTTARAVRTADRVVEVDEASAHAAAASCRPHSSSSAAPGTTAPQHADAAGAVGDALDTVPRGTQVLAYPMREAHGGVFMRRMNVDRSTAKSRGRG